MLGCSVRLLLASGYTESTELETNPGSSGPKYQGLFTISYLRDLLKVPEILL